MKTDQWRNERLRERIDLDAIVSVSDPPILFSDPEMLWAVEAAIEALGYEVFKPVGHKEWSLWRELDPGPELTGEFNEHLGDFPSRLAALDWVLEKGEKV